MLSEFQSGLGGKGIKRTLSAPHARLDEGKYLCCGLTIVGLCVTSIFSRVVRAAIKGRNHGNVNAGVRKSCVTFLIKEERTTYVNGS
jgi:hypothetical protein